MGHHRDYDLIVITETLLWEGQDWVQTLHFLNFKLSQYIDWDAILQGLKWDGISTLEYRIKFWSPQYKKDVVALRRIQKRFTRMLL